MRPPASVDLGQARLFGLTTRQTLIAGVTLFAGIFILAFLGNVALYLRGMLAVFLVGAGLALMFGQIEGMTLERWVLAFLDFQRRPRVLVHGGQNSEPDARRVTLAAEPQAETSAPGAPHNPGIVQPRSLSTNFFFMLAEAACFSLITGICTYWCLSWVTEYR
mgnify:CR=1 FL=1